MKPIAWKRASLLICGVVSPALAQHQGHMQVAPDSAATKPHPIEHAMPHGMDHSIHSAGHAHAALPAFLGPYSIVREASGTAWQPEASPHRALHAQRGSWSLMLHGYTQLVADRQGGGRGDHKVFANQMVMGMATRPLGATRLGVRAMLTGEPATIGQRGYPLLLQSGETADGRTPLIDRQHPHDLFMELAATLSVARRARSLFVYAGLPGEPALGPPVFMHRFSGESFPEAPISHHWLDSSHISFGVITAGATAGPFKLDASLFRGREPDQNRWNIERPELDSHAFRVAWNPTPGWALQASRGRLESVEQLEPEVDVERITASAIHHRTVVGVPWQTLVAWGRNDSRPGPTLDAWLVESVIEIADRHTVFARAERTQKNELFPEGTPQHGVTFTVAKLGVGYLEQRWQAGPLRWGLGVFGTVSFVPRSIRPAYGDLPLSASVFAQARLR